MGLHGSAITSTDRHVKVVFVNRYFFPDHSATSQLLSDLAFALAARERAVFVVTSRQTYDNPNARLASAETIEGVRVLRVWTSSFGRGTLIGRAVDYLTFYTSAAWHLWRLLTLGDVVVAKTDPPLISVVAAVIVRLRGASLVNWLQDVFPEVAAVDLNVFKGRVGRFMAGLRDWSLSVADWNVVIGRSMAVYLESRGISKARIAVIANWADGEAIVPIAADQNPLRGDWGLAGKFVVGYSGNMGQVHEFGTILDAAELLQDDPRVAFVFIGGGKWRDWIEQEARRRGLRNFAFKPYQPRQRLAKSLSVPDVHLISLRPAFEGLIVPSKFYGIAAAGRPIIFVGDPHGEIGQLLRDCSCGVSVRQGDGRGLALAIREFHDNVVLRNRIGCNGRQAFEQRWNKTISYEAWWRVLR